MSQRRVRRAVATAGTSAMRTSATTLAIASARASRSSANAGRLVANGGTARPQAERVAELRRGVLASLIAVKGHLDTPYPDDPRWTPWTRFVERAMRQVEELAEIARQA